jgi:hypothetical protein
MRLNGVELRLSNPSAGELQGKQSHKTQRKPGRESHRAERDRWIRQIPFL